MSKLRIGMEIIRTAAALIAATALVLHSPTSDAQSRLPGPWSFSDKAVESMSVLQAGTWHQACVAMEMTKSCRDLHMPKVAYGLLPYRFGMFDLGSRTVLIDIRLLGQPAAVAVMFHEMIHFLQGKKYPLAGDLISHEEMCVGEKEAHDKTQEFARKFKINDPLRVRPWTEAGPGYGCILPGGIVP